MKSPVAWIVPLLGVLASRGTIFATALKNLTCNIWMTSFAFSSAFLFKAEIKAKILLFFVAASFASAGTVKAHPANETTELLEVPKGACLPHELGRLQ